MHDEPTPFGADITPTVKDRVRMGAIPGWVNVCSYTPQFKSEGNAPVTYLLLNTQINADRRELFVHQAIRLETMEAVQHHSQWRLQFEPKTQLITLHSLKIRRGEAENNHLTLEKAHFLQREEGLERFVILGWFTILMILDDVRPGDILEFAYTIETQPRLLPNNSSYFFALPQAVSVGKYHFAVHFDATRAMKWKSSAADLKPLERNVEMTVLWEWSGENYTGLRPESNTPSWHLAYPWIQISDFPDWQIIASAIAEAWMAEYNDQTVVSIAQEIESKEPDLPARIERAIRLVQDECRYFSVNLELGGQIPSTPEMVMQRRFGDCKDLSWLLVNLLKKLGVQARPVLVNTFLKRTIGELLPTPSLFNHVVVEFEAEGKKRWVDTTLKEQGGGPFNRIIAKYDLGLPIDAAATGLVSPPQVPEQSNLFELRESILLDTSGAPSLLAVIQQNEGDRAEILRQQITKAGLEEVSRQRLQSITSRFRNASRIGSMQCRDDRTANRFILAEVFEIHPFLGDHPNNKLCRFQLQTNWITGVLPMPEKTVRKSPFALPYPCHITYIVEVESPSIRSMTMTIHDPRSQLSSPFVEFSRKDKAGQGYLLMNLALETKADSIPTEQVEQHRQLVRTGLAGSLPRVVRFQRIFASPTKT